MNDYTNYIGKVLDKRYKILELVGVGGMACVLRAQDLVMNRTVAIKILNDEYNGNEQAEHRFIDESKAVAMLSHKNIVSIYDVAIYPDIKYIVMEYIDGITLREYLDNKGALPWNEACIYVLQILRALEHAHSKGVIHRDIKPQNIILQKNGEIKVMDFGIAKIPTSAVPGSGKAVGTVYYIAPEQASGRETNACSDIYSVGILLYEAVTGTLPFKADSPMAVAAMQVNDEPPNPRDLVLSIPVGVSQIILKAMMKNPAERFRSAHSMSKAIEWVLRNPDVIFSLSGEGTSSIGDTNVVSIDMIDTAEITPYGEEEIAQSLGKKTITEREREQQKQEQANQKTAQKKKKKRRSAHSGTMFPVILGIFIPFMVVALVVGVMLGVAFLRNFTSTEEEVNASFPNIIGEQYSEELRTRLLNGTYGQTFVIDDDAVTYTSNPDKEDGVILSTEPAPNQTKKANPSQGELVFHFTSVVVNRLESLQAMPDLVGYTKGEAQLLLQRGGVDVNLIRFDYETDPSLNVLFDDQVTRTVPAAGEDYKYGDMIVVYLCRRTASTANGDELPNCVGASVEDAVKWCEYALYTTRIEYVLAEDGDYTVTAMSEKPGATLPARTEITLTVSRPAVKMPRLSPMSLPEAQAKLDALGIAYTATVYGNVPQGIYLPSDPNSLISFLQMYNIHPETNPQITEDTKMVAQSVEEGTLVPLDDDAAEPVTLYAVNYAKLW